MATTGTLQPICEIEDCGRDSVATMNGVRVCERCRIHFCSVGLGAVHFAGRWHGVIGVRYTSEQRGAFPGLAGAAS